MWGHLVRNALAQVPARLLALDDDTEAALRRFAGRRVCLELPMQPIGPLLAALRLAERGAKQALQVDQAADPNSAIPSPESRPHLLLEFAAAAEGNDEGPVRLRLLAEPPADCDLWLGLLPLRTEGNRRLGLRLLATLRRYRPDPEDWLELWLGAGAAGQFGVLADSLRQVLNDLRAGARPTPTTAAD